jgi:Fe-S-cluster-containing dehydrogenase component
MARKKTEPLELTRREFLAGAGTVIAFGAVSGLAACTPSPARVSQTNPELVGVPVSALIVHNAEACAGCGVCGLMCAFYHEKEFGPAMARNDLARDPFNAAYTFNVCQQCKSPNCYWACPQKDKALCIDPDTGVKYVNTANCIGCGSCTKACPFTPPRANVQPVKKVSFKCDLCRDRPEGPICVEYCTMGALRVMAGSERG